VEGGAAEGVLECGALETFVVVDRDFANELHPRFCAGSFWVWMEDGLQSSQSYYCHVHTTQMQGEIPAGKDDSRGRLAFRKRSIAYWKTGGMRWMRIS